MTPPIPFSSTHLRTVRGRRASAVLLFYTDQMNRVHSSEEAPRSFTMAPCVVVERLEGKQRCSRATVSEHAGIQAREWSRWLFTKKREVNENDQTLQQPIHNNNSAAPRQHPTHLHWCGADPPLANPCRWPQRACPKRGYISAIFPPFLYVYTYIYICSMRIHTCVYM